MKTKILMMMGLLIAMVGCHEDAQQLQGHINGTYVGIFERNGNSSGVELTFNRGAFNGQSEIEKFPALCNGTYVISGNSIIFANDCPWTAEFDWSLILSDAWNFGLNNNILTMTHPNGDKYTLTQQ